MSESRIKQLDGLRGVAVLMVIVWHYYCCLVVAPPNSLQAYSIRALSLTYSGVDLFFVLSGFLIGGILLDSRNKVHFWSTFYKRRTARILPVYVAVLLSYWLAARFASLSSATHIWLFGDPLPFWSYALFLQNIAMGIYQTHGPNWLGITWSLAVEEQFYLVTPFLIRYIPRAAIPYMLAVLIILAVILRWMVGGFASLVNTPFRADALLLGVLLAWAVRVPVFLQWCTRNWLLIGASLAVFLCGIAAIIVGVQSEVFVPLWLALTYALLILWLLIQPNSLLGKLFSAPVLMWFGSISYALYMYHQAVSGLVHGWLREDRPALKDWPSLLAVLVAVALSVLLAWASMVFYERPFLRWAHRSKT